MRLPNVPARMSRPDFPARLPGPIGSVESQCPGLLLWQWSPWCGGYDLRVNSTIV